MKYFVLTVAACLSLSSAATVLAGATLAQKCEAGKLKAAGKAASCRANALAKVALGGTADPSVCDTKLQTVFAKLEAKGGCTTALGEDLGIVTNFVDTASACNAEMLSGTFPTACCSDQGQPCAVDNDCCGTSPSGFIRGTPYFCNTSGGTAPGFCDVLI
jgi:hypothetical protein